MMPCHPKAWYKCPANRLSCAATIDEAVETSCNLLCGGFSRESIFRLKCFDVYKSPTWCDCPAYQAFNASTPMNILPFSMQPVDVHSVLFSIIRVF